VKSDRIAFSLRTVASIFEAREEMGIPEEREYSSILLMVLCELEKNLDPERIVPTAACPFCGYGVDFPLEHGCFLVLPTP
jgi:hypothetical protein